MEAILCHKCKKEKLTVEFYLEKTSTRGYNLWCKECYATWQHKRQEEKAKEWKVEKNCKICEIPFMPRRPFQTMCGSKKCAQQSKQRSPYFKAVSQRAGKKRLSKLRESFLSMYGSSCRCCGETQKIFLTIDHKKNDGCAERQRLGGNEPYRTLADAIKIYDPAKYQVLCFNCNCGRNLNEGICPHQGRGGVPYVTDIAGRLYRQRLHEDFLGAYGKMCACCGESVAQLLTVDHIKNDGGIERKKSKGGEPYKTIRNALTKYQPGRYQTLCFNCNCGKSKNGGICPHKVVMTL
jgi:hypothetical protein